LKINKLSEKRNRQKKKKKPIIEQLEKKGGKKILLTFLPSSSLSLSVINFSQF